MKSLKIKELKRNLKFWQKIKAENQEQKEAFKKQIRYSKKEIARERQEQKKIYKLVV